MHLCVVGTGAAGWMAANWFTFWNPIQKISVIGSPEILPIGVGESNTLSLNSFHNNMGVDLGEFITSADATVKTGVFYENWAKNNFIHNFKGEEPWKVLKISAVNYFQSFANKPEDISFHEYYAKDLFEIIQNNHLLLDEGKQYPISYHFDAAKYINFLEILFKRNSIDKQTEIIKQTVVDCVFDENCLNKIKNLVLSDGRIIEADYFIFATGSSSFSEKILKIQYESLSDVLLTNKAWVYPLEYSDKRNQFHPYTVAKTMKYGWRWITPTWSRIGTGYVFSARHVDADKACQEFLNDIGDKSISPRLVDFTPRYSKKTFYDNFCLLGMCNGFLEPLDAPGLTLTIQSLQELRVIFNQSYYLNDSTAYQFYIEKSNEEMVNHYKFWASFILAQYKTCHRNDSDFWKDHKNVQFDYYDNMIENMSKPTFSESPLKNRDMFYHTISAKNINWEVPFKRKPFKIPDIYCPTIHHEDYISSFYAERGLTDPAACATIPR